MGRSQRFMKPKGTLMGIEQAEARRAAGLGDGRECDRTAVTKNVLSRSHYTPLADVHTDMIRRAAYDALVAENHALDDLAGIALSRAFMAGWIVNDPTFAQDRRDAYRALYDATRLRLIERCRAAESADRERIVELMTAGERARDANHAKWLARNGNRRQPAGRPRYGRAAS
jgi:hypothetical protein